MVASVRRSIRYRVRIYQADNTHIMFDQQYCQRAIDIRRFFAEFPRYDKSLPLCVWR